MEVLANTRKRSNSEEEDIQDVKASIKFIQASKKMRRPHDINLKSNNQNFSRDFESRAKAAMGAVEEGDAEFGPTAEINLNSSKVYDTDANAIHCPRKPKYYNRVHTGYEWNKYNRTHYDHDNPPPMMVRGYKFNIFYPDLIDKTITPQYFIEKDDNNTDTCVLRFHAGPPYEDIAFRIVNDVWQCSRKKGFKCTFDNGILHLYFYFQRYCYRR